MKLTLPAQAGSFAALPFAQGYALAATPRRADPPSLQRIGGQTMGTHWSVRFVDTRMRPLAPLIAACQAALDEVVAQMSTWEADSAISRFNRAPAGSRHVLPDGFAEVLRHALHHAAESGGAFDPTVGALIDLWGFGPRADGSTAAGRAEPPAADALRAAQARCGWQRITLGDAGHAVQPGGVALDFSGIAKGYAVDRVCRTLASHGIDNALVDVGGDMRAAGHRPGGDPWRIGIAHPDRPHETVLTLALRQGSIATSGDTWHAFVHEGRRYSHTLDPRSGLPVRHPLASVSVLHEDCVHADALATVLGVLGSDDGHAWASARSIAALFVDRVGGGDIALRTTRAFDEALAE